MPVTTETTEDFQGIIQTGRGLVTGDELVQACHAAFHLVQNTRNFHYEFVDLTDATALQFSPGDLEQITERDRMAAVYRPDAIVVIVAPQKEFYDLAKAWESRVQDLGWTTHITRDRAAGLKWLKQNFQPPAVQTDAETSTLRNYSEAGSRKNRMAP